MNIKPAYYDHAGITIHHGDCREALQHIEGVDAVVTDPPYGLGFMGKDWDHNVPGSEFWSKISDSMKPGAHLLAFGGTRTFHRLTCAIEDAGFEIRDCLMWVYGSGFPKSLDISKAIDKERGAKQWDGWGTALKPAWEPIIVARKPLNGTVASNVLEHGTGGMNIDACRVECEAGGRDALDARKKTTPSSFGAMGGSQAIGVTDQGRWPANVIHDGSEEVVSLFPSPHGAGHKRTGDHANVSEEYGASSYMIGPNRKMHRIGDECSAARFFYTAKASKSDRGENNNHPTVKPTELMRYLIRLITPPGGTVLDPFMGSGSTLEAAKKEWFKAIGIELEESYCEIATNRFRQEMFDFGSTA